MEATGLSDALLMTAAFMFVPLFGQLCLLVVYGLILIRGNDWAWYSEKWATVDDLMTAKRPWSCFLIALYAVYLLYLIATC